MSKLSTKIKRNVYLLRNHKNTLDCNTLKLIYLAQIQSHINYGLILWGGMASSEQLNKIRKTLNMCVKILKPKTEISKSYSDLKILTLDQLIELEHNKLAYKISKISLNELTPELTACTSITTFVKKCKQKYAIIKSFPEETLLLNHD